MSDLIDTEPLEPFPEHQDTKSCLSQSGNVVHYHFHEQQSAKNPKASLLRYYWKWYQSFVLRNEVVLNLIDDALCRLIYWMPSYHDSANNNNNIKRSTQWREILYSLLSLNRFAMDCATSSNSIDSTKNLYGTTVLAANDGGKSKNKNGKYGNYNNNNMDKLIPSMRFVLTILNSLVPSILEIAASSSSFSPYNVRLYIERVKFVLRMTLLGSYWKQQYQQQQQRRRQLTNCLKQNQQSPMMILGLLQNGGIWEFNIDDNCLSMQQEERLYRRQMYKGRRTGRKVILCCNSSNPFNKYNNCHGTIINKSNCNKYLRFFQSSAFRIMIAELLFIYRPLYWASQEAKYHRVMNHSKHNNSNDSKDDIGVRYNQSSWLLWKPWILSLGMDGISLLLLIWKNKMNLRHNPYTMAEYKRRQMKLFLYLLRSPIWNKLSKPTVETVSDKLERYLPIIGNLMSGYLWEWIMYLKHPFVSEEG